MNGIGALTKSVPNASVIQTRAVFAGLGGDIRIRRWVSPDDIVTSMKSTQYSQAACLVL